MYEVQMYFIVCFGDCLIAWQPCNGYTHSIIKNLIDFVFVTQIKLYHNFMEVWLHLIGFLYFLLFYS